MLPTRCAPPGRRSAVARERPRNVVFRGLCLVRDTGIEPVTSSVSGKRATAAPIALNRLNEVVAPRWRRDSNPRRRLCRPLPNHSATPPGTRSLEDKVSGLDQGRKLRADDGSRTRDPHHGKVMLYQLSYVRIVGRSRPWNSVLRSSERKLYHKTSHPSVRVHPGCCHRRTSLSGRCQRARTLPTGAGPGKSIADAGEFAVPGSCVLESSTLQARLAQR